MQFLFLVNEHTIIFVSLLMFLSKGDDFALILTISSIPMGPALTALFSVMGKLVREKDVNVTNYFFKSYKTNFLESLFFWILELIVFTVVYVNKLYALSQYNNTPALQTIFIVLMFICISLIFHIFPIISRFYIKKLSLIKIALYYSIKKIHISILGIASIYIMWILLLKVPSISLLVILLSVSIIGYLIMYLYKGILIELEEKFKNLEN